MLLKWIVCQVPPENRPQFSQAQLHWSALKSVPGFVGQVGGWNIHNASEACILACWQNNDAYQQFMTTIHDQIVAQNQQGQSYTSIAVALFTTMFLMPGVYASLEAALEHGTLLRTADCLIKPESHAHFVTAQEVIWKPAMQQTPGMLGGVFTKADQIDDRYFVATLWKNIDSHQHYVDRVVPGLRERARLEEDIAHLAGRIVLLEESWLVL